MFIANKLRYDNFINISIQEEDYAHHMAGKRGSMEIITEIIVSLSKVSKGGTRQSEADPRLRGNHPEAPEITQLIKNHYYARVGHNAVGQ